MITRRYYRLCAALAWSGVALLVAGTWLHPSDTDPADSVAAFTEYATTPRAEWVLAHVAQLAGVAATVLAVVLLAHALTVGRRPGWSWAVGALGAANIAVAATLQAVDGVALKAMADRWAAADADRSVLFGATQAVREIEIGLDALLSLTGGAAIAVFGLALLRSSVTLGALAVLSGLGTAGAGVLFAVEGYSATAMLVSMVTSLVWLLWTVLIGVWAWRRAPSPAPVAALAAPAA